MSNHTVSGDVVLLTFALSDESHDLTASLTRRNHTPGNLPIVSGMLGDQWVVIVHTGVGDEISGRKRLRAGWEAARRLTSGKSPRWVISAGYAGGLHPSVRVGDLVLGENHSDSALVTRANAALAENPRYVGVLLTQNVVAETAAAKATLHAATGALAVDMETAWIAAFCAEAGSPMLSLRVVSDAANLSFPVPGHILFDAIRQRPRFVTLPLWLLTHPASIAPFMKFVRGLAPARARLTRALVLLIRGELLG